MNPGTPPTSSGGQRRSPAANAGGERRVVDVGRTVPNVLDDDIVTPVVAEVVDVEEPFDASADEGSQANAHRVVDVAFEELVVRKGLTVDALVDHELEQMRVGPADGDLDDVVQGQQGGGERHVDAPPERRFDLPELDSDACNGLDHERAGRSVSRTSVTGLSG